MTVAAIRPPSWGYICFVDEVPVLLDADWNRAVYGAGPETPADYDIHRVGHLYPPTGSGLVCANFVLVNLTGGRYQQVLDWAKEYELPPASPRHIFALTKYKPYLHRELAIDPMCVVSPIEQSFRGHARICSVSFRGGRREANARWVEKIDFASGWVAFLRLGRRFLGSREPSETLSAGGGLPAARRSLSLIPWSSEPAC